MDKINIYYPEMEGATPIQGQIIEGNTINLEVGESKLLRVSVAQVLLKRFPFLKQKPISIEDEPAKPLIGTDTPVGLDNTIPAELPEPTPELSEVKAEPTEPEAQEEEIEIDLEELEKMGRRELQELAKKLDIPANLKNAEIIKQIKSFSY